MMSLFCVSSSALTVSSNDVIRVYGLKKDGTPTLLNGYTKFDEGWEAAVDYAEDHDYMDENGYERISVDFLADWNANENGEFGKSWEFGSDWGDGFQYSTIFVPSDTKITINLNGHTINRGLRKYEYDGEVICINDDADLIINGGKSGDPIIELDKDPGDVKMGTITGGWSCNGAGGIHMQDGSKLTLNNVNIVGNTVEDDDGGGIAVYDGAELIMNGGSIANNTIKSSNVTWVFGAGIYIKDSTASVYNVTFQHNHSGGRADYKRDHSETYSTYGVAIYSDESKVTIDSCKFYDNAHHRGNFLDANSVICATADSEMTIKNTIFKGNGAVQHFTNGHVDVFLGAKLFNTGDCDLTIEDCQFIGNNTTVLLEMGSSSSLSVSNTHFTDNNSSVYSEFYASSLARSFVNCTFDQNISSVKYPYSFEFSDGGTHPTFVDCDFGDSSFNDRSRATIIDTDAKNGAGSIFGAGSLVMIIAVLALVSSAVSISLTITFNKKKAVFVTANEEKTKTKNN